MGRRRQAVSAAAIRKIPGHTTIEPLYLSVVDAEKMTSISRWTWRHYCYQGLLDHCKVGGRLLLPLTELHRVLEEGTRLRVKGKTFNELAASKFKRGKAVRPQAAE